MHSDNTKEKISIGLPKLPKGKEFEEYISAFFQSAGNYYVERNIIERGVEEILELDIIATDYNYSPPKIKLLEIKSGKWGFPDLFKMRGWMDYLNIDDSVFIANTKKDNVDYLKKKAKRLNIDLEIIPTLSKTKKTLPGLISKENIEDVDIASWRFSYWVERNLLTRLKNKKKSEPIKKCFTVLDDYYFRLNSETFFTENIIKKVSKLYSTFQEFPYISAKCGNEIIGKDFEEHYNTLPKQIYKDTYYNCSYNGIQISTFIEHRARLAILKNAVDYKLYKDAGTENKDRNILKTKITGLEYEKLLLKSIPSSFIRGLEIISKHKYFYKYPVFWQWFMWLFGGFILKDYEEKEYEILSRKTGIPIEEIPNALESYQILFPQDGGWFIDLSPNANIKIIKMFPVPFMGIGANYRRLLYTKSGKFEDLKLTGKYTLKNLINWNNLVVKVLSPHKEKYNIKGKGKSDAYNYFYDYSKGNIIKFVPAPSNSISISEKSN